MIHPDWVRHNLVAQTENLVLRFTIHFHNQRKPEEKNVGFAFDHTTEHLLSSEIFDLVFHKIILQQL